MGVTKKPKAKRKSAPRKPNGSFGKKEVNTEVVWQSILEQTLMGASAQAIATQLGIAIERVYKARSDDGFKQKLSEALDDRRKAHERRLLAMTDAALRAHLDIIDGRVKKRDPNTGAEWYESVVSPRERLAAAMSILDRSGLPRESKIEQGGEVSVTQSVIDMSPFKNRTIAEKRHYLEHGVFPDGSKPVAQ